MRTNTATSSNSRFGFLLEAPTVVEEKQLREYGLRLWSTKK